MLLSVDSLHRIETRCLPRRNGSTYKIENEAHADSYRDRSPVYNRVESRSKSAAVGVDIFVEAAVGHGEYDACCNTDESTGQRYQKILPQNVGDDATPGASESTAHSDFAYAIMHTAVKQTAQIQSRHNQQNRIENIIGKFS